MHSLPARKGIRTRPNLPGLAGAARRRRSLCSWGQLPLLLLFLARPVGTAAKEVWQPVAPEELAATKSTLEPDAPAEALVCRWDVDDDDLPRKRHIERYVRFKIYAPEKAEQLLRLAEPIVSYNGTVLREVEIQGRLHLPDGSVRDFGAESVRERDVVKQGSADSAWRRFFGSEGLVVKEKFLAVVGAVPGAILEYSVVVTERGNWRASFHSLQLDSIPVRQVYYRQQSARQNLGLFHLLYVLNSDKVKLQEDPDHRIITAQAHDLRSLSEEPLSGSLADRAVTLLDCYVLTTYVRQKSTVETAPQKFAANEPWAPLATLDYWITSDHVDLTKKVRKTAADLTKGAASDAEKARRIHDFVQGLHQHFIHTVTGAEPNAWSLSPIEMNDVLDFAQMHPENLARMDFLWLAISLYRAAGLRTEEILLPDRNQVLFSPQRIAPAFLPARAAAVRIGEAWHFSMPHDRIPLAFDELPWENEGLGGLLALDHKQELIEVPSASAAQSLVYRTGAFHLDPSGTLTGESTYTYHGHESHLLRAKLLGQAREAQLILLQHTLGGEFDGAEIEVTDLRNVDDVYQPLEVAFKVNWPGFGVTTDRRMIFRPFAYRTTAHSPFAATNRRSNIVFPFRQQEVDELTIALPAGFSLEAKEMPPSHPGPVLSYKVALALDQKHMVLHVSRDFTAGAVLIGAKNYTALKNWYDAVADCDQHNLMLVEAPEAAQPTPPPSHE